MRRNAMLAAALVLLAPFAAAAAEDSVVVGMRLEPKGLDPTLRAEAAISQVTLYNIYETLTRLDESGAVRPMLAENWTLSDDGLAYTFNLVEGVKFHDGTDFDASDVKFTFERNAAEDSQNKRKAVYQSMAAIETPDPHTVVIRLEQRNSLLPFELAQATGSILAPESAETNATDPVGTGPYEFVEWIKGDSVKLRKFAGHRNADQVQIENATFRFVGDEAAQVAALLAGDLDYMPALGAPELFPQFENNPEFTTLTGTTEGETILAMNNKSEKLSDVRVRRAIAHAIDRQAVIDGANAGYGTPIGSHFAPHHPAYVDLTGMYEYSPEKAKALLKEAGHGDRLTLRLRPPSIGYATRSAEIIADMLAKVGIKANIEITEFPAVWIDQVYKNKQYDLSIIAHVEPLDIKIYANPDYYFQYDSPEFREILDKAEAATTVEEQRKWFQEAQRKLAEDSVNGFLFELPKLGVAKKGLTGMWANWPAFINDVAALSWEE